MDRLLPSSFYRVLQCLFLLTLVAILVSFGFLDSQHAMLYAPVDENGCPTSAILLDDGGRMGNQFFEYLQAAVMAERAGRVLYVKKKLFDNFAKYFDGMINRTFESVEQFKKLCWYRKHQEFSMSFKDQLPSHLKKVPYIILKRLMPANMWKTLLSRRAEFLESFQWKSELKADVSDYLGNLTEGLGIFSSRIAVHVRMQDYYNHLKGFHKNVTLPGHKYFNESMNYFRRKLGNPVFVVVSNDMQWCRDNLKGSDVIFAGRGNETDPGWDLALLSSCDHLIMTYGSYGVMAAYFLAGVGEIIAADKFTGGKEIFTEHLRASKWPHWHWIGV